MNQAFQRCMDKKKIVPFEQGPKLVAKELRTAAEDLEAAKLGLKSNNYKWPTIQAYYSQFHSARALLYLMRYREKSHYCLLVAIKELFVKPGLLEIELADAFYTSMILRENADYRSDYSESGAENVIDSAAIFLERATAISES